MCVKFSLIIGLVITNIVKLGHSDLLVLIKESLGLSNYGEVYKTCIAHIQVLCTVHLFVTLSSVIIWPVTVGCSPKSGLTVVQLYRSKYTH